MKFIAILLLTCACAQSAAPVTDPSESSPPAPPASTPPADVPPADLVDAAATVLYDVSPDGQSALVSHGNGDLWLVSRELAPVRLAAGEVDSATIIDGSFISVTSATVAPRLLRLSDGADFSGTFEGGLVGFAGEWLYQVREAPDGRWVASRQRGLAGVPQLLIEADPFAVDAATFDIVPHSPDGESYMTCPRGQKPCDMFFGGAAPPVPVPQPQLPALFSRDNRWVLIDCALFGADGTSLQICAPEIDRQAVFAANSATLAVTSKGSWVTVDLATHQMTQLAPPPEKLGRLIALGLTPDGSRLSVRSLETTTESSSAEWMISSRGGEWGFLANGSQSYVPESSPDSRILAGTGYPEGVELSVGGATPSTVTIDGKALDAVPPLFEPPGGHGRALFNTHPGDFASSADTVSALGNADGSGDWVLLPPCKQLDTCSSSWAGHSVVSRSMVGGTFDDPRFDIFATPANGKPVPLARNVRSSAFAGAVAPALMFIADAGGLYAVAIPQPE